MAEARVVYQGARRLRVAMITAHTRSLTSSTSAAVANGVAPATLRGRHGKRSHHHALSLRRR